MPTRRARLYMKKIKIRDDKEAWILASFMGEYTYEGLSKAVVTTFPTAAVACSGARLEAPRREQYHTKGGRGRRFWRKPAGKGHRFNEVKLDDEASEDLDEREDPSDE